MNDNEYELSNRTGVLVLLVFCAIIISACYSITKFDYEKAELQASVQVAVAHKDQVVYNTKCAGVAGVGRFDCQVTTLSPNDALHTYTLQCVVGEHDEICKVQD